MRISFIIYSLGGGGAERMVCRLANAFCKKHIDTDIIFFESSKQAYYLEDKVRVLGVEAAGGRIRRARKRIRYIRDYIKRKKPDVIYCFMMPLIPYAVLANLGLYKKCKVIGAERANPTAINKKQRFVIHMFLRGCDGFVFQTNGAKSYYPKWVRKRSAVIGNIAPSAPIPDVSSAILKNAVCSVGRLHDDKDFDTLMRAFKIILDRGYKTTLHIYGDGPLREDLARLAVSLGIGDAVIFEGFSEDMAKELSKYEIFAFSSKAEGMPNALMEAMSAGMACVSTDCDFGPSDLIKDGVNGFLVPVGDSKAMAGKLIALFHDETLRKEIGKRAKNIKIRYSEEKIVGRYLAYAQSLVQS